MLTISLDESTGFEGFGEENHIPAFIAGLAYDDRGSVEDAENERRRATEYFKSVCMQTGTIYPRDLHVSNAVNNRSAVWTVKTEMFDSLPVFLQNGTYRGRLLGEKPRHGKYHIFAILKSEYGKSYGLTKNISNLVEEDFASNLYTGMAYDIISRLIFHNPIIDDISSVKLELPTRAVPSSSVDESMYLKLGYKLSSNYFPHIPIMSADGYRSAIQREMLESGKTYITIEGLKVQSIQYQQNSNDNMDMTYLYLADAICAFFSNHARNVSTTWEDAFSELSKQLNKHYNNLIFSYDSVDTFFSRAWKALEAGDFFEALSLVYDSKACTSKCHDFYKKYWFSLIEDKIVSNGKSDMFEEAVLKLHAFSRTNNLHQDKLLYIFQILEQAAQNNKDNKMFNKSAIYALYDTGLDAFNHFANTNEAGRCFQFCRDNAEYANIENYLATLNKRTVQLLDSLQYEKARELANETVEYEEELLSIKQLVYGNDEVHSPSLGRSLSQSGQAYAAMQDKKAEELFLRAMLHFTEGSADYYTTLSYFLHYCISMNLKEQYDVYTKRYFDGRSNLNDQLQYMLLEGKKGENAKFTLKYALFFFVKGIYYFHIDDLDQDLKNRLLNINKVLKESLLEDQINGHPWELIYKYIAFIALKKNHNVIADKYMKLTKDNELIKSARGFLLDNIIAYGLAQYDELRGDKSDAQKQERKIWISMGNDVNASAKTIHEDLEKKFTFMYV